MSYCTLEEAFGNYNECKERQNKKKKKINCNKNKTKYTENEGDLLLNTVHKKKQPETFNNYPSLDSYEYFSNFESSNVEPNEIYEYSENDNKPLVNRKKKSKVIISADTDSEIETDNESDNESDNSNNTKKSKNVLTSQISEINNKINFIMNQLSNKDEEQIEEGKLGNNIHDIVLFILFGIFIILILEILYKVCVRITMYKFNSRLISDTINNATII